MRSNRNFGRSAAGVMRDRSRTPKNPACWREVQRLLPFASHPTF